MRKALKGELPFLQKAQELQEDLLTLMPYLPDEDAPVLEAEENYVENAKKIFLMIAGLAVQKYEQELQKEQEILRDISDIAIETFAMESALLRTKKAIAKNGEEKEQLKIDYTRAFIYESMQKVDALARHTLAALEEGDVLRTQLSVLKKFTRIEPINEVAVKRDIAARIIDAERYVC
jgi:hypothetical protein